MLNPSTSFYTPANAARRPIFQIQSGDSFSDENIESTIDIWDIKKVPSEFESVSKPSRVVAQLLEKKKNLHEFTLKEMNEKLFEIQEKCADEIKAHCFYIKLKIADIRKEISDIQKEFENDLARYSDEGCKSVRKLLMTQLEREMNLIGEFQLKLKEVEQKRVVHVKETIIKYQDLLNEIGFVSPDDSVVLTNDEVREYNIIILKNHRAYETLIMNMRFVTYELTDALHSWLEKIRIWQKKP